MSLTLMQIGMNTADLPGSLDLFSEAFGFRNAGGQLISGDIIQIQGLDRTSRALMWWLVGAQPRLQFEFFHHTQPAQRPLRADWTPADLGWSRFGIAVAAFDHAVSELAKRGIAPIAGEATVEGLRRMAYRDPFIGVVVEVMEDGPALRNLAGRTGGPALVYVAASVSDLGAARTYYEDVLGLPIATANPIHPPGSDALWGLPKARTEAIVVNAGGVFLEIAHYASPEGRPRMADYRASDQGIVNVALGAAHRAPVEAAFARLAAAGYRPPFLVDAGEMLAGYITEPEREVEFVVIPPPLEAALGFAPVSPFLGSRR